MVSLSLAPLSAHSIPLSDPFSAPVPTATPVFLSNTAIFTGLNNLIYALQSSFHNLMNKQTGCWLLDRFRKHLKDIKLGNEVTHLSKFLHCQQLHWIPLSSAWPPNTGSSITHLVGDQELVFSLKTCMLFNLNSTLQFLHNCMVSSLLQNYIISLPFLPCSTLHLILYSNPLTLPHQHIYTH